MMQNDLNILVSGASIAGLSTAYWLNRYGFKVTVVERAPYLRPGGQALDVRGPALDVAERMGILADLQKLSTRLTGMSVVDGQGKELYRSTERTLTGGRIDSPDIEVLRDDLCKVLYESVGNSVEFLFDDRVTSINQDGTGVDATFAGAPPRRFDLVIGADGLHSGIRRLVFGPEHQFLRFMGVHIAVFSIPNFLGLDHWEIMCQDGDTLGGLILAMDKDSKARVYLGFNTAEPLDYDPRDITAQKRLIASHYARAGWEFPRILAHMQDASDFYFYSANQVRMDNWSRGRVVLVGDAGYSVTPATGQGTTVAMVGAYVLAGELATHKPALVAGIGSYETELRDYVTRNLDQALDDMDVSSQQISGDTIADGIPDFGQMVQPIVLKNYQELVQRTTPTPQRRKRVGPLESALQNLFTRKLRVLDIEDIGSAFRIVTLGGDVLRKAAWTPGDKIQIQLGGWMQRTYTPMDWDAKNGRTRILVYLRAGGPGTRWARALRKGDTCTVFGPRKSVTLKRPGAPVILFGDETSFGLAAALSNQRSSQAVQMVFEVSTPAVATPVLARLHLDGARFCARLENETHFTELEAHMAELLKAHATADIVLTGKASSIQRMSRFLRRHRAGAERRQSKPYWAQGKTGLD